MLFVLGSDGRLAALSREEGNVAWVTRLDIFENLVKKRDPITYMGPVLAGGRLMVVSSTAMLLYFDPMTGAALGSQKLSDAPSLPPVIAGSTMYIVTDDANLTAYR
jgi:outer membrane protein assembly factor BamB